jgi:NitT/TauT family transport system permease protein
MSGYITISRRLDDPNAVLTDECPQPPVEMPDERRDVDPGRGTRGRVVGTIIARPEIIGTPLVLAALLALWWWVTDTEVVAPLILPGPSDVVKEAVTMGQRRLFLDDVWVTTFETVLGLLLSSTLGITIGAVLAYLPKVRTIVFPYITGLQVIPTVAIAPVFIAWLGFGQSSKVALAVFISFFPIVANTMDGMLRVPENSQRLMSSLTATSWQRFRMLTLPAAAPQMLVGVKIGATLALVGAIVGEVLLAQEGLGKRLIDYSFTFQPAALYATLFYISFIGLVVYGTLAFIQGRYVWWESEVRPK